MSAAGAGNPGCSTGNRAAIRTGELAGRCLAVAAARAAGAPPPCPRPGRRLRGADLRRICAPGEIRFAPLEPESHHGPGRARLLLHDSELPSSPSTPTFDGGVRNLTREHLAAASALPNLLRTGGTAALPPDSVDERIELMGLAMSFGQGGGGATSSVNTLSDHMDEAVRLWASMLRSPRFDSAQVERWRGSELERVRRGRDDPGTLAFGRFNHIMYGDHPVGWEMDDADLEPSDLAPDRLRHVHGAIICPDNMVLGVTGDVTWPQASALLEEVLDGWPPCSGALLDDPVPVIRDEPGVFVIHREIEQSVIVMAHGSSLRQGDTPEYFASRVANSILGASGFSSRLVAAVRTREGLAYGASSLWTTSSRNDGLVGALTRTRPETTLEATRLILATIGSMRAAHLLPRRGRAHQSTRRQRLRLQLPHARPGHLARHGLPGAGLPDDWLERYVQGIQGRDAPRRAGGIPARATARAEGACHPAGRRHHPLTPALPRSSARSPCWRRDRPVPSPHVDRRDSPR